MYLFRFSEELAYQCDRNHKWIEKNRNKERIDDWDNVEYDIR